MRDFCANSGRWSSLGRAKWVASCLRWAFPDYRHFGEQTLLAMSFVWQKKKEQRHVSTLDKTWPVPEVGQENVRRLNVRGISSSVPLTERAPVVYNFLKSSSTLTTSLTSLKNPTDPAKSPSTPAPRPSVRPSWDYSAPSALSLIQSPCHQSPSARKTLVT